VSNAYLELLLSRLYDVNPLDATHRADLYRSGLTDQTIALQKFRTVPPDMIDRILGFRTSEKRIISAYLLPYADPGGGWMMDYPRMKIFPTLQTKKGTLKYLQSRGSGSRLFFPLATLDRVLHDAEPIWLIEGEKKAAAVAQLGLPAIGFAGIEGWHLGGSKDLLPDFGVVPLKDRTVELVPDGDVATNLAVERGAARLARALEGAGACVRLVRLPVAA
jgi:hypothetical protein